MPLSWNEIKDRALAFSKEWANEGNEKAEAQTFWNEFFNIFGLKRRSLSTFEEKRKKFTGHPGFIDLFWPGMLLVEHKSAGQNLDSAFLQATDYFLLLSEEEKPRYVIVSDFQRIRLYDLEAENDDEKIFECSLKELPSKTRAFGFMAGYNTQRKFKDETAVNIKAAERVAKLHDALRESGYSGHALEMLLVRLVFCFFAEDTNIFDEPAFLSGYIENRTKEDGSDLGLHLSLIFQTLNTTKADRQTTLDEDIRMLPYVDGHLFEERLQLPTFNAKMRKEILGCCAFNWSSISPAVFGAMFQSAMNPDERHDLGAHYTSEKNILKVISGLFLDDLRKELDSAGNNAQKLHALHDKMAKLSFLDPACGCGNFLVVTYRELRMLEIEILKRIFSKAMTGIGMPNVGTLTKIGLSKMHGIEIEELPSRIASLALWLTNHQMNMLLTETFGEYITDLPLPTKPNVIRGNALQLDWESVVSKNELSYILGNPPFIGSKVMDDEQRNELATIFGGLKNAGVLDYVTGWYVKAARYIHGTMIGVAFVSTNSITQGEQVGVLWRELITRHGVQIIFAHRTFRWSNEARGKAAVYCVIVGFALNEPKTLRIYDYEDVKGEPHEIIASHISPYLVDAPDIFIDSRSKPLCDVPEIGIGNKPIDGGNYLFSREEKDEFLKLEPAAAPYFRRWLGAEEFINGGERWCLWLGDCPPDKLRQMPKAMRRVEAVRTLRKASPSKPTQKLADTPTRFHVENMPLSPYLLIPKVSSERRRYIPTGFIMPDTLASDLVFIVPEATLYHFGVLTSEMHMAWVRQICGRLKSDYRYSKDIVYNNFPWPTNPTQDQIHAVENAAKEVLDTRKEFTASTLADLYDPLTMPSKLLKAHKDLDAAVDKCYGKKGFKDEPERLTFLFKEYGKLAK